MGPIAIMSTLAGLGYSFLAVILSAMRAHGKASSRVLMWIMPCHLGFSFGEECYYLIVLCIYISSACVAVHAL